MLTAGMVGVAAATALMITVGPGTSLWWIRALLLLLDSAETETLTRLPRPVGLTWFFTKLVLPVPSDPRPTARTPAAPGASSPPGR